MKAARVWLIVCLTAGLLACGQKGPLVLPDKQKPKRVIPSAAKPTAKPSVNSAPAPAAAAPDPTTTPAPSSAPAPPTPAP